MGKHFQSLRKAATNALESKYFILFCISSIILSVLVYQFLLDLCSYGFLELKTCSSFRAPGHGGFYRFSTSDFYILEIIFFLIFIISTRFFIPQKNILKSVSIEKRLVFLLILPMLTETLNKTIAQISYEPVLKTISERTSVDCCVGKIIFPWGEINNLDTHQSFCRMRLRGSDKKRCLFSMDSGKF